MSLEENLADLERHARDFADRTGFTYTVLDPEDDVIGCVYVYPAGDDVHDARVLSWVRESRAELDASAETGRRRLAHERRLAVRATAVRAAATSGPSSDWLLQLRLDALVSDLIEREFVEGDEVEA